MGSVKFKFIIPWFPKFPSLRDYEDSQAEIFAYSEQWTDWENCYLTCNDILEAKSLVLWEWTGYCKAFDTVIWRHIVIPFTSTSLYDPFSDLPLYHDINESCRKCASCLPLRCRVDVAPIKIHEQHRNHLGVDGLGEFCKDVSSWSKWQAEWHLVEISSQIWEGTYAFQDMIELPYQMTYCKFLATMSMGYLDFCLLQLTQISELRRAVL